jgi:hypothetical protein
VLFSTISSRLAANRTQISTSRGRRPSVSIIRTEQFGSAKPLSPRPFCNQVAELSSEEQIWALRKKCVDTPRKSNKPTPRLRNAPQPPLLHRGAPPDSDRAKKPPLVDPSGTGGDLSPGDRVEGLGDFGMPTGEFGTVRQVNEDDALVKWDDDGRMRVHKPSLKNV